MRHGPGWFDHLEVLHWSVYCSLVATPELRAFSREGVVRSQCMAPAAMEDGKALMRQPAARGFWGASERIDWDCQEPYLFFSQSYNMVLPGREELAALLEPISAR